MVIFIKRRRRRISDHRDHSRVNYKGHLYIGGVYAGFADDSFKLSDPPSFVPRKIRKPIVVPRQVCFMVKIKVTLYNNPTMSS